MSNLKTCDRHALRLRQEIEQRGMKHLINHDLEKQAAILGRLQYGRGRGKQDFDPWILAQLKLAVQLGNSMEPRFMVDMLPDHTCPLCMVSATNTITEESWIKGVCNELLEEAWEWGLMTHGGRGDYSQNNGEA